MGETLESVINGPDATKARQYGITSDLLKRLKEKIDCYADVIMAPQQSIAERKARTAQLPDHMRDIEPQFTVLDDLILQFGETESGRELIDAYQASRLIRDHGRGRSRSSPEVVPTGAKDADDHQDQELTLA